MLLVGFSFGLWCLYNYVKYRGGREKAWLPEPLVGPYEPEEAPRRILLPRWRMAAVAFTLFSGCLVLWTPSCGERLAGMGDTAVSRLFPSPTNEEALVPREAPGTRLVDVRPSDPPEQTGLALQEAPPHEAAPPIVPRVNEAFTSKVVRRGDSSP